jgi:glycosyltransferase involved in cell wall biosynthesis
MSDMRIAVVSTPFISTPPRDYGGTELVVSDLVEGLVDRGHDVTLFATGDSSTSAELRALYPVPTWPPDTLTDVEHVCWALREAAELEPDVIHVNSPAALSAGRFIPDVPLVYTIHHSYEPLLSQLYGAHPEVQYVAISSDQRSREPGAKRCRVIHHGLDERRYAWRMKGLPFVSFLGRLSEVKGAHTAIDAAALAGVPIRVAGRAHPTDKAYAQRELADRLQAPHVTYLGAVGTTKKVPLLRDSRALLVPITWDEPFGLVLIEAMLAGCPVVAYPRGSVPELVEQGVTGFVVSSLEEMAAVIAPGGPVDQIDRQACRARAVQRFSRSRMVASYERLYADVMARRDRSGRPPIAAA